MSKLQTFKNIQFGEIRVIEKNRQPWFVAADICKALDLSNPSISIDRLDADEKAKLNLGLTGGETNCVNEYGLYSLVLGSRKPEAKAFKRWITHEVLPSIRKHGGYIANQESLTPEQLMAKALMVAQKIIDEKDKLLQEQKPKVLFAEALETSNNSILVGELAKILKQNGLEIGQNRLFQWLRDNNYLIRRGEARNMPTQYSMELGLFEIKVRTINNPDGSIRETKTPKVTAKGQIYFVNKLMNELGEREEVYR
ncbi:MAG: phage antirepressor Ant [Clostridiaceae bacterium]|nr:phage antirepressor Ant [Clostridiaceae bacterium]